MGGSIESEFVNMTASRRRFSQEFKDELCQEVISEGRRSAGQDSS
jgi:transposase-like protein